MYSFPADTTDHSFFAQIQDRIGPGTSIRLADPVFIENEGMLRLLRIRSETDQGDTLIDLDYVGVQGRWFPDIEVEDPWTGLIAYT